jgi:hypothetical protein
MAAENTDMLLRRAFVVVALMMIAVPAFAQLPWYEGGTLQKGTVADWQAASAANQLASSADFIASLNGVKDIGDLKDPAALAEIRKKSDDLQVCINQSIQPNTAPDQPIAELIVRCTILKGK